MRKLQVGASKKQRRKQTEYRFEERFGEALTSLGVLNHHACPVWEPGIMDRYVAGGRWIEFKSLAYDRSCMPWNAFSLDQKRKMQEFSDAGEKVWVCVLLCHEDDGDDDRILLRPWPEFKKLYARVSIPREEILHSFPLVNRRNADDMGRLAAWWSGYSAN